MEIKPKIFVSYTTLGGVVKESFLNKVCDILSFEGYVYIDLIHNDSIDKQKRVMKELSSADLLFLIKTEKINDSNWVNVEINRAKELGIPIVEFEYEELINKNLYPFIEYFKRSVFFTC